jgi:hypothetical protein
VVPTGEVMRLAEKLGVIAAMDAAGPQASHMRQLQSHPLTANELAKRIPPIAMVAMRGRARVGGDARGAAAMLWLADALRRIPETGRPL